jgi:hypothetical protein
VFVKEGEHCYDVDILQCLEALLSVEPVMEQIQNFHSRSDRLMADVCDTPGVKDHPLFGNDQKALQVILYYDDVEICNPLGSNTKKHKLGRVCMSFSILQSCNFLCFVTIYDR